MTDQYEETEGSGQSLLLSDLFVWLYSAFVAWKGFRLLVLGASGVGKSTFWKHLETGQIVTTPVSKTEAPTQLGGSQGKLKLKDIAIANVKVRIRAVDVPGDADKRDSWKAILSSLKPQGIIFMLDHVHDVSSIPSVGFDQERLNEHYQAFEYLRNLIQNNVEVQENLQALLVLVNKSDKFPSNIGYGDILRESRVGTLLNSFNEIGDLRTRAAQCSALYGENVTEQVTWLIKSLL